MFGAAMLTAELLRDALDYDLTTGRFTWKKPHKPQLRPGDPAGSISKGYRKIKVGGRTYSAHRLAWLFVHGRWPISELDHIDGDKQNNAIANLRECSRSQNIANAGARRNSNTGIRGVYLRKNGRFEVVLGKNGKPFYVGIFADIATAAVAAEQAARVLHGEFAKKGSQP